MIPPLVETLLWKSLLGVVAFRPWVLDHAERVPMIQWIGLFAALLWWIGKSRSRPGLPPRLALACLIVCLAFLVSSVEGHDRAAVLTQGHGLMFGMLLCAGVALASHSQRRQLRWVLLGTGTLLAVHALWQAFVLFPALANFPWRDLAAQRPWASLPDHTIEYATQVVARRRVFGPFPLPGLLGAALAMLLPLSVATLAPAASTRGDRLIAAAVVGVQTSALLLTQSLAAIGSTCAARGIASSRSWR